MAIDSTITGLPTSTTPLDGSEVLPIDQSSSTKKTTILSVLNTIIQKIGLGTEVVSLNDGNSFLFINRLISTPASLVKLFLSKTGDEASLTATDGTKLTTVSAGVGMVQMQAFDGTNPAILFLTPAGQAITSNGSNNNFIVKDYISSKGIVNASDYSANFTPESLVTKRFTDATYLTSSQSQIYAVATGTDTYAITLTPAITTLTAGLTVNVLFTNANTTAITINVNALGAKAVTKDNISPLVLGDIKAGVIYTMTYDGTRFQCDCGEAFSNSPTFTGVPIAPTATLGTNTTQLATTAFVLANASASTLTSTQIAFGSTVNSITSNANFVVNTATGYLSAPLVINVGGIPTGGYDIFNHFQMPEQLIAFKSTTAGKSSEIQVYNNLNVLQFGIEGSTNGNRMGGTIAYNMYFGCYYNYGLTFHSNNLARGYISGGGNWFFGGNTTGTAIVHIKAGTATANTAPLKFTSGTNLTTVEDGSIEYDSTNFFASAKGTRQVMLKGLSGSFSGTATATTAFTVTFGNTQPNVTYQVNITPTNALTAAVLYVTSKTTTTFTVTFLTGLTGAVAFDWVLTQ